MSRETHDRSHKTVEKSRVTDRLHQSAYAYYSAAHTTSGDGSVSSGTKRLLSAALLSSASLLALGSTSTSVHAQAACVGFGNSVTCSGNVGATPQRVNGNNLNVTIDNTFVQDTSLNMTGAAGQNTGVRLTGDSGAITNNGSITTGETGTDQGQHHGIQAYTSTVASAFNAGTITNNSRDASAVRAQTYLGGVAVASNDAGGVITLGNTYARGVTARGTINTTARNLGTITGTGSQHVGVYANGVAGEANASNAGTINLAGNGNRVVGTIGIGANGDTTYITNSGSITMTGSYAAGIFGRSQQVATTNITNSGSVTAGAANSVGIIGTGPTINITNTQTGVVTGGAAGIVFLTSPLGMNPGAATIVNNGTVNGGIFDTQPEAPFAFPVAPPSATITNTGTVNGVIGTPRSVANITNNGGTVGDNSTAIYTGFNNGDQVTVTGAGNVINGTIRDASTFGGNSSGNILTFGQTDTVRLTQGQDSRYPGGGFISVSGFDEVRFAGGTTEFVGDNAFFSTNNRAPYGAPTAVTVGPGATFKVSGGTTTFGRPDEGIKFGGTLTAAGAGTQRGTVEVAAGGRLNFTGDVTFGDKGRFKVGIAGQNNAGYLQGNNVTFNAGSEIYADLTRGIELTDGQGIKVANATNMLTDNGANVYDNSALVNFTKSVVGNDLFLIPQRGVRAVPATDGNRGSSNARNIAAAIDAFIDTAPTDNPIVQFLAQFPIAEQEQRLAQLVQDTLPSESGSTGSASVVSTDMVIDLIMERLSGGGFNVVDSGQGTGKGGRQTGVAAGDLFLGTDANLALWGRVGGSFAEFTPSGVNGFDSNTYAVSIGIDGDITPEMRFGLAGFYSDTDVDENGANSNSGQQIEGLGVLAYASWRPQDWYVNGTVGYGHNTYKSQRTAAGAVHTASFDGTQLMSRVEAGRIFQFDDGALDITPHVGLRANKLWLDGYTEAGPVATTVNSQNITSVRAVAGVGARYTFEYDNGSRFLPEGYVRGLQELADPSQAITGSVVGGGQFVSTPTERDDFSYAVGAGFTYEFTDVFSVRLLYDGEFQDDYREDSVTAAIRVEF